MSHREGLWKQLTAAILLPLLVFLPVSAQAMVRPSNPTTPVNVNIAMTWQRYLAQNLPSSVNGADRTQIYDLLSKIENLSREATRLTTAGVSRDEVMRRVGYEVQEAITELSAIGERLDQEAAIQELQQEIAKLKEQITNIEEELVSARGLRWQVNEIKRQLRYTKVREDKENLKKEKEKLEREIKSSEQELKFLRKSVEQVKNGAEEGRARIVVLETLLSGDPNYHFGERLIEVAALRLKLAEKEKALAALLPPPPEVQTPETPTDELARIVTLPENEIRELSLKSELPKNKRLIESFRALLKQNHERKKRDLKNNKKAMDGEKKTLQKQLKELLQKEGPEAIENRGAEMDCRIFQIEKALAVYPIKEQALERAYDNFEAKLDFFANWPAKYAEIQTKLADRTIFKERFMDYPLIGNRDLGVGDQADDIGPGMQDEKQIREELERAFGYFPEEIKEPRVVAYFESLARLMQMSSDLKVPLRVHVLKTPEINAFAIRGGAIYFFAGLLVADKLAEASYKKRGLDRKFEPITEAMLVGVTGHEISHITLRHAHQMNKPLTIANILMSAAMIAIMMGTLGFGWIAYLVYYYGMPFLSLALSLKLLGISREHETEADMVGAEYTWKAGFDPRGNIDWHEWLAKNVGYVRGAGYFYTHPPAYERIWNLERVLAILPMPEDGYQADSQEFHEIREIIWNILSEKEFRDKVEKENRPTLKAKEIELQKRRDERCKPYLGDQKVFDPFDETPFQTPLAVISKPIVFAACPANVR